jgi:ferredoxin-NADP reductase
MFHTGKIVGRCLISPTVMRLDIHAPSLKMFKPGQWVDFVAKPNEWVGGFSIVSNPRDLPIVTLAVKRSDHPPATWIHNYLAVDDTVEIQVGGDCTLEEEQIHLRPSVFCAGGIGISPILSQYREYLFLREKAASTTTTAAALNTTAMFLYSASTIEELVFADELAQTGAKKGHDIMVFTITETIEKKDNFVTKTSTSPAASTTRSTIVDGCDVTKLSGQKFVHVDQRKGRILIEFLDEAPEDAIYYLCGPTSMIDDAVQHLSITRKIPLKRIKYEKWW